MKINLFKNVSFYSWRFILGAVGVIFCVLLSVLSSTYFSILEQRSRFVELQMLEEIAHKIETTPNCFSVYQEQILANQLSVGEYSFPLEGEYFRRRVFINIPEIVQANDEILVLRLTIGVSDRRQVADMFFPLMSIRAVGDRCQVLY